MNIRIGFLILLTALTSFNLLAESSESFNGNYSGKIGSNLDVGFHMENKNGKISGFYYYEKFGFDIVITGSLTNQDLTVYELDSKNDTVAIIKGTVSDSVITGEWINAKTGKSYSMNLRKIKVDILPLPKDITGTYKDSNCNITVNVSKTKGEYFYKYTSKERTLKGKMHFTRGGEICIVLEGMQYSEESDDDDENSIPGTKVKKHIGIEGMLRSDEIVIQNTGNEMNYYVKLNECDQKYIELRKN